MVLAASEIVSKKTELKAHTTGVEPKTDVGPGSGPGLEMLVRKLLIFRVKLMQLEMADGTMVTGLAEGYREEGSWSSTDSDREELWQDIRGG